MLGTKALSSDVLTSVILMANILVLNLDHLCINQFSFVVTMLYFVSIYTRSNRSSHSGFIRSINLTRSLFPPRLICFSRKRAASSSSTSS
jgi:hypothetical protein